MKRAVPPWAPFGSRLAPALFTIYKSVLSPMFHTVGGSCRFQPTCSEYAAIAIAEHGLVRGGLMALGRVLRCHPLHRGGYDPVRPRSTAGEQDSQISQRLSTS